MQSLLHSDLSRQQGGGTGQDAGVVLSAQRQERAHQETDRPQPHVSVERTVTCNEELVRASYSSRCACVERRECAYVCMCIVHSEKEEDLEKRQFFINRELRPLMQLTGQEKKPKALSL